MSPASAVQPSGYFNPLPPCGGRRTIEDSKEVKTDFNPLPPCGGRPLQIVGLSRRPRFQSTPSVWRETPSSMASCKASYFNPLPPCGGRPCALRSAKIRRYFNPLPPCGGRHILLYIFFYIDLFQSTPSVWRETLDVTALARDTPFQSTPSVWRETRTRRQEGMCEIISIHSLRVEGDLHREYVIFAESISIHSLRVEGDRCVA